MSKIVETFLIFHVQVEITKSPVKGFLVKYCEGRNITSIEHEDSQTQQKSEIRHT